MYGESIAIGKMHISWLSRIKALVAKPDFDSQDLYDGENHLSSDLHVTCACLHGTCKINV